MLTIYLKRLLILDQLVINSLVLLNNSILFIFKQAIKKCEGMLRRFHQLLSQQHKITHILICFLFMQFSEKQSKNKRCEFIYRPLIKFQSNYSISQNESKNIAYQHANKQLFEYFLLFCLDYYINRYKHIEIEEQMHQIMLSFLPNYQGNVYYLSNDFYPVFTFPKPYIFMDFNNSISTQLYTNYVEKSYEPYVPQVLKDTLQASTSILQNKVSAIQKAQIQNVKDRKKSSKGVQSKKLGKIKQKRSQWLQKGKRNYSKQGKDRFIKKNTESNIVNQTFSFIWTPKKSQYFLLKILSNQAKIDAFYKLMKTIKANCKSQINRFYLKSFTKQNDLQSVLGRLKKKGKMVESISLQQISISIKKLAFLYLRSISRCSIMTSKKMNPTLWKLHFRKCDQITAFLLQE